MKIGLGKRTAPALCVALMPFAVDAAAQTPAERKLEAARSTYEAAMEAVRTRALDAARKNSALPIKQRQDQVEMFKQYGQWPGDELRDELAPKVASARAAMQAAYAACLEAIFAKDEELAKVIRAEWDQWEQTEDLLPWSEVPARKLESAGDSPRWRLPVDLPGTFRLEIRGRAKADTPVRLLLPGDEGPIVVRLAVDGSGFHAILTYGPANVLATDQGALRTSVVNVATGSDQAPVLDAVDAQIELLRWKNAPIRILTEAERKAAMPPEVASKIKRLERTRKFRVDEKARQEKKLAGLEKKAAQYEALIRGRRGRSSDLRSDLYTCMRQIKTCKKRLEKVDEEIAEIDEQLEELRAPYDG